MTAVARAGWLYAAAMAASLAALPLHFIGEEGILAVSAIEMWYRNDWLRHWIYGVDGQHGTFAQWLIIPLAAFAGWEHVLAATRAVMIAATAATGAMLYVLASRLWRDRALAALAAAVYVTFADVALYRGWLGYRDPLLAFLTFSAMAALWLGARERRVAWLAAAAGFLMAAFLTKGPVAYAYAGAAGLVLLFDRDHRAFLLRPLPLALGALALALPYAWLRVVLGAGGQGTRLTAEIFSKLVPESLPAYAAKLALYPLELGLRLLPASALVAWLLWRRADVRAALARDRQWREATLIAALCIGAFWLAPHSHVRYLAPVLPLVALAAAVALRAGGDAAVARALRWGWALVAMKLVLLLVAFPAYQERYRGAGYAAAARDIVALAGDSPLYVTDASASGLNVTAHVDIMRLPRPPIGFPPQAWADGLVIAREADPALGAEVARYRLGGDHVYVLCRGSACPQ